MLKVLGDSYIFADNINYITQIFLMAISFNKREQEKKKQQKKLEKQKRKDERKANAGTKSFEDMIAYVDENGMLTDTPVDLDAIEEIDPSTIELSIPKKEATDDAPLVGYVDFFNAAKGFGFIKENKGTDKYFFHISNAPEGITEGNKVEFEIAKGLKGMDAINIVFAK